MSQRKTGWEATTGWSATDTKANMENSRRIVQERLQAIEDEDEDAIYEAQREDLLESLEAMGIDEDLDWPELPVDLNVEGDPTRNGAFK